jgi:replicative DNA helicase
MSDKNFGYLGHKFQLSLLFILIIDKKFSHSILYHIDPKYFDNQYYKLLVQIIKEYRDKHDSIPTYDRLEECVKTEVASDMAQQYLFDTIKELRELQLDNGEISFIKEKALKFCKQQELHKAVKRVDNMIKKGEFENYDKAEELIRTALAVGVEDEEDTSDAFDDLEEVLSPDFRHPIPTGISGIDKALKGGLGKGELGVVIAPTGIGKSTFGTKVGNHAYKLGYNVLHIFFEDLKKQIQRKHITALTGISPDEQGDKVEEVKKIIEEFKVDRTNKLLLRKYPSEALTFQDIKQKIQKIIADVGDIDLMIIDYVDCINNEGQEYENEGKLMRQIECFGQEINVATWIMVQGNRASISSDVVTTDQMQGSIKKAQVGHVIITIAKNLNQKEHNLATIAITKSRVGDDGIVFDNCKFNNKMLDIDTDSCNTFLGHEQNKELEEQKRVQQRIARAQNGRQNNITI